MVNRFLMVILSVIDNKSPFMKQGASLWNNIRPFIQNTSNFFRNVQGKKSNLSCNAWTPKKKIIQRGSVILRAGSSTESMGLLLSGKCW